jgi:hypothetical protein
MGVTVEGATKKVIDIAGIVLPRRQADIVHHQQADVVGVGAVVKMTTRPLYQRCDIKLISVVCECCC